MARKQDFIVKLTKPKLEIPILAKIIHQEYGPLDIEFDATKYNCAAIAFKFHFEQIRVAYLYHNLHVIFKRYKVVYSFDEFILKYNFLLI